MLGGALLLGGNAASAQTPASPPRASLPGNWRRAETLPLWPGQPPGAAGFRPQTLPADWSEAYRINVATPELHVFRPRRPNGISVVAMPGGAYWFVSVANEGAELAPLLTERGITVFVLTYRLPGRAGSPVRMFLCRTRNAQCASSVRRPVGSVSIRRV